MTVAETIVSADDGGSLRHQLYGLEFVGGWRHIARRGIIQAQHGNGGAKDVHGQRGFGRGAKELHDLRRNGRVSNQALFQGIDFRLLRQLAFPEQVDDFFKGGVISEFVDIVSAVAQDPVVAIDVTDFRFPGDDAF